VRAARNEAPGGRKEKTHLGLERIVPDGEQTLGEEDLELLDEDVLGVVDADEELDDVGALALAEICAELAESVSAAGEGETEGGEREGRTVRSVDGIGRPLGVVEVLGLVSGVADEAGAAVDELLEERVARLDQALHDAADRVLARSAIQGSSVSEA